MLLASVDEAQHYLAGRCRVDRMRGNKIAYKVTGIIMAMVGAAIVIHTVPVYLWLIVLLVLVLAFVFMLPGGGRRRRR